jgi:elongation factor Tu
LFSDDHEIEATIRYLTTAEGGRKTGVISGYRGQFHYQGDDQPWDGFQYFPDLTEGEFVELGTPVRALIQFRRDRWDNVHSKRISIGMPFEIREGRKLVGRGTVTRI